MAASSVSFRISRSAEDLAETIHALSQRLVQLEQRLAAMELQAVSSAQDDPAELESLSNVERLLQDCRQLLATDSGSPQTDLGSSQQPLQPQAEQDQNQDEVFLDAA
jgi:hypothetical protein